MATTTNFGWETPDDTDLVKDGAAAMRTLGNSIDTSFVDLKGGTTGQVLSKASNTDLDYTWVTTDDANAIQNTIVDAKGDLIAASAADTPARLAVGTNGYALIADSTASTGLKWAPSSNFIGASVYPSSSQSLANSTNTKLNFANEVFDTNSFHDNSTNNTRFTIPAGLAGYYRVSGSIRFDQGSGGRRIIAITINGGGGQASAEVTPANGVYVTAVTQQIFYLNAGDYVEFDAYQTSGGNLFVIGQADSTFFQIERIGQ